MTLQPRRASPVLALAFFIAALAGNASAQSEPCDFCIEIPNDLGALQNTQIDVPINLVCAPDSDWETYGLTSFGFELTYNPNILEPVGFEFSGTIYEARGWDQNSWLELGPGHIRGACAGEIDEYIDQLGTLVYFKFDVSEYASPCSYSEIGIPFFNFNEFPPLEEGCLTDGFFFIPSNYITGMVYYWTWKYDMYTYVCPDETYAGDDFWDFVSRVPGVDMTLVNAGPPIHTITDEDGNYVFCAFHGGFYCMFADKDEPQIDDNAVTAYDASLALQYWVGIPGVTLEECQFWCDMAPPFFPQLIAGDVTGDGTVGHYDASRILTGSVHKIDEFTAGDWKFFVRDGVWCDQYCYGPLMSHQFAQDWMGIMLGDISGNYDPALTPTTGNDIGEVEVTVGSARARAGQELSIPISVDEVEGLTAVDVWMSYDPSVIEVLDVELGDVTGSFDMLAYHAEDGHLKIGMAAAQAVEGSGSVAILKLAVVEGATSGASDLGLPKVLFNEVGGICHPGTVVVLGVTPVDGLRQFALRQNHPNPFNPKTAIAFSLPAQSEVSLTVYDVTGRVVRSLTSGEVFEAGDHSITWSGKNDRGEEVSSGIYFYRLTAGDQQQTKRMLLVK